MRRTLTVLLVIAAIISSPATAFLSAQTPKTAQVTVNVNGAPAANLQFILNLANKGKTPVGTTNAAGQLVLDLANMPKVRVEVAVEDCPEPEASTHILISQPGAKQDDRCRRRLIAFWLWGNGNIVIDTGAGTLQVIGGQPFITSPTGLALLGGAGAAAVGVGLAAGNGYSAPNTPNTPNTPTTPSTPSTPSTPTTPSTPSTPSIPANFGGTYRVTSITVMLDPNGHRGFVNMEVCVNSNLTGTQSGNTLTLPGGAPWITLVLQVNTTTGAVTGSGTGSAAGRTNVQWSFTGTMSTNRVITGQMSIGNNNTLPNGPIVYTYVLTFAA